MGGGLGAEGRYPKTVVLLWPHPRDEKQADVSGQRSPGRRQRIPGVEIPRQQQTRVSLETSGKAVPRDQQETLNHGPMWARSRARTGRPSQKQSWECQSCRKRVQWGPGALAVMMEGFQDS